MNDETLVQAAGPPVRPGAWPAAAGGPPGFDLLEEVGRGGMGVVFRARDRALNREVAVKLLLDDFAPTSATAGRFVAEAQITGQLQHPGIPAVYQVGTLPTGRPFLAMKLIRGRTLAELLAAGVPVDPLAVVEAIGQAVGYAHAHGVIHRDLKPANVMVGSFGEVQVMDWGLAKVLTADDTRGVAADATDPDATTAPTAILSPRDTDGSATRTGSVLGTPAYMAPEQAAGELAKVGPRADVFGLGAIFCVLLTGRPPFAGQGAESVRLNAVRGKTAEAFARLDGCGADPDAVALCKRCLAFEPADRPATADAVAAAVAALRRAADDRVAAAARDKLAAEVRAAEQVKRRRAAQRAAAAVAAVLLLGVAGTTAGLIRADAARRDAEDARGDADAKREVAQVAQRAEADQRRRAQEKEAEANAVVKFVEDKVFAAARPKGLDGGLGAGVTLREAVAAGLPALATDFPDQPLVEARLRTVVGATLLYLGDARTAGPLFERARDLYAARLGPDHPDTLQATAGVASVYEGMNRPADALALREQVAAAAGRAFPADHPVAAMSRHNLAVSYARNGRFADALPVAEEVLATRRRVLPPDHEDTLRSMILLIGVLGSLDRHADALEVGRAAAEAGRRSLPPDHALTLSVEFNMAVSHERLGRPADALPVYERVLAARRRVLPPRHPETLKSLGAVGTTLVAVGRGKEGVPLIDECVAGAAGQPVSPRLMPSVLGVRSEYFQAANDPAGGRGTAEMWEALKRPDPDSLFTAARFRAVAAGLYAAANQPTEAAADADRAMAWLRKAVAGGYKNAAALTDDAALDPLRNRADFRTLLAARPTPREAAPPPRPVP